MAKVTGRFSSGLLIPFHLPPCDVVPAAHLSLGKMLINHHGKMAEFDWNVPPSCSCQEFIQEHPDLEVVTHPDDGQPHAASPLNKLSVSRRLKSGWESVLRHRSTHLFNSTARSPGQNCPGGPPDILFLASTNVCGYVFLKHNGVCMYRARSCLYQ